ncbi:phage terminase large subunit [bacterium]|nr:phage terminase large subunit [bacterium]
MLTTDQPRPATVEEIDCDIARRSLAEFIQQFWRYMDPSEYVHGWHIDAICEHLEAVARGDIRRLLINVPPRHCKSITVSVAWPAWLWAQKPKEDTLGGPGLRLLYASYAQSLSIRDSVKCRRLIESDLYRQHFGDMFRLTGDQNTKQKFENDKGGVRIATSVDGSLTGEGGDIIVVDDPHNVRESESEPTREAALTWWDEAMSTRLNDPRRGAYVVIMQRVHERDLAGHILEMGGWEHLCLPAEYEPQRSCITSIGWNDPRTRENDLLWEERYGQDELEHLKAQLGSYAAAGQLQQRPAPREGGIFKRQWFQIVAADRVPAGLKSVRFWDFAASEKKQGNDPDWTAGVKIGRDPASKCYYIQDVRRVRETPQKVEALVKQTAELDGHAVPIRIEREPGSSGVQAIDYYVRQVLNGYDVRGVTATGDKFVRMGPLSAQAEAGNVYLVQGPWNRDYLSEAESIPKGAHDDQLDATAGGFGCLTRYTSEEKAGVFAGVGVF